MVKFRSFFEGHNPPLFFLHSFLVKSHHPFLKHFQPHLLNINSLCIPLRGNILLPGKSIFILFRTASNFFKLWRSDPSFNKKLAISPYSKFETSAHAHIEITCYYILLWNGHNSNTYYIILEGYSLRTEDVHDAINLVTWPFLKIHFFL